jgi:signal transduction histidine kinase/DNA-binding NarL/FixJ family response regulator
MENRGIMLRMKSLFPHVVFPLLLVTISIVSCQHNTPASVPRAKDGSIDLRFWNFETNGPVKLQGEWKFAWNSWEENFISSEFDDSAWGTLNVPELWNSKIPSGSEFGYGCLRLTIRNVSGEDVGLLLQNTAPAYVMYANGVPVSSAGRTGKTRETTVPHMISHITDVPLHDTVVLVWQVSNFRHFFGGILSSPVLGMKKDLYDIISGSTAFDACIMGIILIMGLYHFILWLMRRNDKTNLYFVLFSLMILLRGITANFYPENLFPQMPIHEINIKLYILAVGLAWMFYHLFLRKLYPTESPKKISVPMVLICAAALLFVAVTPVWLFTTIYPLYAILLFIGMGYEMFVTLRAAIKKREGSIFLLTGTLLLCVASVNDVMHYYLPGMSTFVIHIALACFIFMKSIVLSRRYTAALRIAEYLTSHLHKEVAIKTQTIEKQNEKLVELDREKTDYLMNISHEIKTPLTLINNYLDKYIREKGPTGDSDIIKNAILKLTGDVVNFMDFEKLNHQLVFYNHNQCICLSDVVKEIVRLFLETAKKKKITIHTDIQPNLHIKADPSAVERIVNNLIDNGLKYSHNSGTIQITLTGGNSDVELMVQDKGIGIQEKDLEKIFRPYYQISHKKRNLQGLGMGLPIIKKIIEELGGNITIASVPEEGTTVTVRLTMAKQTGRKKTVSVAPPTLPAMQNLPDEEPAKLDYIPARNTVLIVEDNVAMLRFLRSHLSERFNIFEAVNGMDALEKISLIPKPDVILSDIMMDEMDGYEFFDRIRAMDDYRHIPFVYLTAKSSEEFRKKGLQSGAIDYISKPFGIEELILKLDSIISLCQSQRAESQAEVEQKILNVIRKKDSSTVQFNNFERHCATFGISEREQEVLRQIFLGKENKEIALELDISYSTVATHFQNILRKCNVTNKIGLFRLFRPKNFTASESPD